MRILSIIWCSICLQCFAQDSLSFDYDSPPSYSDGLKSLYVFISENIEYPEEAKVDSIEGTVRMCFNIDTSGHIEFKQFVSDSIGYGLEAEAYRVLMLTDGNWLPATKDGKAVLGSLSLPLRFQLE